jgi:hypothetical protein
METLLMNKIDHEALRVLTQAETAGCAFAVAVPWLGGLKTALFSPEQVELLMRNKEAAYAQASGLSIPEYTEWLASGGAVYCSEKTKQGHGCLNFIVGGTGLEPKAWSALREHGGYCTKHGA